MLPASEADRMEVEVGHFRPSFWQNWGLPIKQFARVDLCRRCADERDAERPAVRGMSGGAIAALVIVCVFVGIIVVCGLSVAFALISR